MSEIIDPTEYERLDYYLGDKKIRSDKSQPTQWTPELLEEYRRCKEDIVYFCSKYIKIINLDQGLVNFNPYPYQEEMWNAFNDNRYVCCLLSRQLGKSTGVVGYLLWFSLFRSEVNIALVAHKLSQAREILSRYRLALENLPFFLQPGCRTYNKTTVEFVTNVKIFAAASGASSLRGESLSLVYVDEMGFIDNAKEFMTSTFPVLASSKNAKMIVTSSASGIGTEFHDTVEKARKGLNEFKLIEYDWRANPDRDEEWKKSQIANTNELRFKVEHENCFLGASNTLVSGEALQRLLEEEPERYVYDNLVKIYKEPNDNRNYMMTVDVSKGIGKDYSTFSVFDITEFPYEQVSTFRSNVTSPLLFPTYIINTAKNFNNALVIVESNDQGAIVCNELHYEYEYEEMYNESLTKSSKLGIFVDKKVKKIGCNNLKTLIEKSKLKIVDSDSISELKTFEEKGSSYEASGTNHDDLVANLWLFAWFTSNPIFEEYSRAGSIKDAIYGGDIDRLNEEPFFGILDDGFHDQDNEWESVY